MRQPSPHGAPPALCVPPPAIANVSMACAGEAEGGAGELAETDGGARGCERARRAPSPFACLPDSGCKPSAQPALTRRWARAAWTVQKTLQEERMIRDVQRKDLEKTRATLTGPSPAPSTPAAGADVWCAASRKDGGGADAAGGRGEPAEDAGDGDAVRIGCARALQHRRLIEAGARRHGHGQCEGARWLPLWLADRDRERGFRAMFAPSKSICE